MENPPPLLKIKRGKSEVSAQGTVAIFAVLIGLCLLLVSAFFSVNLF